jgi:hypothetical protein
MNSFKYCIDKFNFLKKIFLISFYYQNIFKKICIHQSFIIIYLNMNFYNSSPYILTSKSHDN